MACCDPAVELLAEELARRTQIRLLVIPRSSGQALDLLGAPPGTRGGSAPCRQRRKMAMRRPCEKLPDNRRYMLLHVAEWEEGLAVAPDRQLRSVRSALSARLRWIGREPGSGAEQCLTEIRGDRQAPRHRTSNHRGVAEAIRTGLVDAGVCLRLVSEQAGLSFLPVRPANVTICALPARTSTIRACKPCSRRCRRRIAGCSTSCRATLRSEYDRSNRNSVRTLLATRTCSAAARTCSSFLGDVPRISTICVKIGMSQSS